MSTLFLYVLANNLALDPPHTLITTSILLRIVLKTFMQYVLLIISLRLREPCGGYNLRYSYLAVVRTPL